MKYFSNEAGFVFAGCSMFYLEEYYRIKGHTSQKIAKYNTQNSEWTLDMFSVYLCQVSYFATFYSTLYGNVTHAELKLC